MGGAAADFVAGLGRKAGELRAALEPLRDEETRDRAREELRRKLHALGVGARLLHFEVLAHAIGEATARLDEIEEGEEIPHEVVQGLDALLRRLPELAWEKSSRPPPVRQSEPAPPERASVASPWTVLVVGSDTIGESLSSDPATFPCEIEKTNDFARALDLARAVAPDLVVVDVDREGALEVVAAIADDGLTGPVPIVAVGEGLSKGAAPKLARLVALGVARAIEKPAAGVTLREACSDVVGERSRALPAAAPSEVGEVTVYSLAKRLRQELERFMVDAVEPSSRDRVVDLAGCAEVLGPFWGALARIRDVMHEKSRGGIAFRDEGLRRPIAIGAALAADEAGERRKSRGQSLEISLENRVIVVADDDAGVASFIAGALRDAGATVHAVADGEAALEVARRTEADVIVTDVVMPKLDGVSLARALRRDVVLRDRPVVLLSWKEDLLQRLRDLRVEGATLRKDDDARTIVARVREVLAPRVRVEARIAAGAEVRGRLDDLSVASLLRIVDRVRHDACVIVRDAAHVYEVELDGGGIRSLARTGTDGSFARGEGVLPGLLGASGARFLVRPLATKSKGEVIAGELAAQLSGVLRALRAASDAIAHTIDVAHVDLDRDRLGAYLAATPEPARGVLERIAKGASPRDLIMGGTAQPSLVEDVLLDAAGRGLVRAVSGLDGTDLVALAAERLVDAESAPKKKEPIAAVPKEAPVVEAPPASMDFSLDSIAPPAPPEAAPEAEESDTPGSLADAVLQVSSPGASVSKPPIIDTRELRPRSITRSDPPQRNSSPELMQRNSSPDALSATPTPRAPSEPPVIPRPRFETLPGVTREALPIPETKSLTDTMPPPGRLPTPLPLEALPPPAPEVEAEARDREEHEKHEEHEEPPAPKPRPVAVRAQATGPDGLVAFVWTIVLVMAVAAAVAWYVNR
ncbi:MAG: response regulator [Polyangiales bacterium]